jgi:methionyl-tRNA formyltransferase
MALNIIFAGTPAFALPSLQALYDSNHTVTAVYTQPDRPAGRGKKLNCSPIKAFALSCGLPLFQPRNFKSEESVSELQSLKADLMVVAAYGLLLPSQVLQAPQHGCINVHASLLPRWRGASPIQYAILKGDQQTGISLMQMNKGLDTGAVLSAHAIKILKTDTLKSVHNKLALLGADALLELLPMVANNHIDPIVQNESLATYAPKIKKEDARINWTQSAIDIDRQIRAFNPYPGAYTMWNGQALRIFEVAIIPETFIQTPGTVIVHQNHPIVITGNQALKLLQIQLPGKKQITGSDFVNAYQHKLIHTMFQDHS